MNKNKSQLNPFINQIEPYIVKPSQLSMNQILNLNMLKNNLYQSIDNTQIQFFKTINEHLNRLPTVNKKIFKFEYVNRNIK